MLTTDWRRICNELMGLYKAQLPLVEPTAMNTGRGWTLISNFMISGQSELLTCKGNLWNRIP